MNPLFPAWCLFLYDLQSTTCPTTLFLSFLLVSFLSTCHVPATLLRGYPRGYTTPSMTPGVVYTLGYTEGKSICFNVHVPLTFCPIVQCLPHCLDFPLLSCLTVFLYSTSLIVHYLFSTIPALFTICHCFLLKPSQKP